MSQTSHCAEMCPRLFDEESRDLSLLFLDLIIFCCSFYLPSRIVLSRGLKEWKVGGLGGWVVGFGGGSLIACKVLVGLVCPLFDAIP